MSASLLQTIRFRSTIGIWFIAWSAIHYFILSKTGLPDSVVLYDSLISNFLLAGTFILISTSLQFYLPGSNNFSYLLGLCAVLTAAWVGVSKALLQLLFGSVSTYTFLFDKSLLLRSAIGFLTLSCMALISVLWYTMQDQRETEKRKRETDKLAKEAELNNLRQQLQPHFLFNSLNSINALIGLQPQKARTMIQQLSDFLRGTLKQDQKEWASLQEELQHLELYLEIEKVRFGHRLSASVTNKAGAAQLPLMLLQPIVENAIKFGLYDTTENAAINIAATTENGYLIIQVSNPYDAETASRQKGTGFGLSSVQRRLYLLFGRQDLLATTAADTIFITTIKIPQP